jgi:hypothetical protein
MPPAVEYQLWRQIRGAFRVDRIIFTPVAPGMEAYHLEQYATMDEALEAAGDGDRVFLEPSGSKGMHDIPQGDIILITGNTRQSNMEYADPDETYRIKTGARTHLYPSEAAAIALAIRHGQ